MTDDNPRIEQPEGDERGSGAEPSKPQTGPFGGQPWSVEPRSQPTERQTEPTAAHAAQPRRLLRSSNDRVLAGVAGGLGRYFGVDPVIFRIGFVLSLFLGGLGGLAYLLLAVFVPTEGDPDRTQRVGGRLRAMGFWRALGLVVIAGLLLTGLFALAGGAAFAVALGWGVPVALVIIAIGALLALAAFRGGARWLIPPAVALALGASGAAAADLDFRGGIGEREYRPLSAESIPAHGYRLGVGRLVVDLRDLDWKRERLVQLKVELGAGQANVFVPEKVCVSGSSHLRAGESLMAGETNDGWDVDQTIEPGSSAVPRLELDANVDFGQLRVINSDTASVDRDGLGPGRFGPGRFGPGRFDEDTAPLRAAEERACAEERG
jgi:phage shock protein PspC (stress-responsive transcriptional regulator)